MKCQIQMGDIESSWSWDRIKLQFKTLTLFGSGGDVTAMPRLVKFTFLISSQDVVKKLPSESS